MLIGGLLGMKAMMCMRCHAVHAVHAVPAGTLPCHARVRPPHHPGEPQPYFLYNTALFIQYIYYINLTILQPLLPPAPAAISALQLLFSPPRRRKRAGASFHAIATGARYSSLWTALDHQHC